MNGGIMICSAGNADSNMISWPACYAPCIAVAATSNQDKRSFYSNYGAWVSISAPGGNFYPFNEEDILSTVPGGEYGYLMGTSMACPHVSGVAALIVSSAKGLLSAGDLKDILLNSTDDISSLNPEYEGMIGTGRLNAYKALIMTQGYKDPSIPKPAVAFSAGAGNSGTMNLHWEPNATSDSVLLAFGTVNKFGTPAGSYNPGDTILHGGKVLFKGKLSDFVQTGLDSGTVCYYSLWSVRNNTYSLVARKASDTVNSSPYGIGEGAIPATNTIRIVPNPSVHSATLHFMLAEPGEVVFIVSDQTGRKVNRIAYRSSQAGEQTLPISLQEWPAGVYFIRMEAADRTAEGKLVVVAR